MAFSASRLKMLYERQLTMIREMQQELRDVLDQPHLPERHHALARVKLERLDRLCEVIEQSLQELT